MAAHNPAMFILAREARDLTQTELARRLGVAQGAVSKIENGVQTVSDEILSGYVRELRFSSEFYEQTFGVRSLPTHFWRKKARVSPPRARAVAARMNVIRMQLRSLLRSANVPSNLVPSLEKAAFRGSPSDAARLVRERWLLPRGPIQNMTKLLEDHGVVVVVSDFGSVDIDGISVFDPADTLPPLILVNPVAPGDRMRWSLAHELGHLVLHTDHNYIPDEEMENEADEFASEFSMPSADIRSHFRSVSLEQLATLKLTWKMSIGSLIMKARRIDAITDYRSTSLWKEISYRGWRMSEPNPVARESPTLIGEILSVHSEELAYTDEQLERTLYIFGQEIRSTFMRDASHPSLRVVK